MEQQDDSPNIGLSNLQKEEPGYLAVHKYNAEGFILTDNSAHSGSIVLYKNQIYTDLAPKSFADLNESLFRKWVSLRPELVLIGTGAQHHFLTPEHMAYFYSKGIGIEAMRTDSACRTYSILAGEMRNTLVILFPYT